MKNKESEVTMIPLDQIVTDGNIRNTIEEHSLKELAKSIKSAGLLQPIGVAKPRDNKYRVVFGHRRVAAAKLLGWTKIPAIIMTGDNLPVLAILENLQRENLTNPELALALKNLADSGKWSQAELARMLGKKDKSYISRMVKLGQLVKEYGETVSYTKLPISVYWELLETPELLIRAEDEKWDQKKAREKAAELKKLRQGPKENTPEVSSAKSKGQSTLSCRRNQNLESYEPIKVFDGGFEIYSFTFTRNSTMDIEAVIEKMTELQNRLEDVIKTFRNYQSQRTKTRTYLSFEAVTSIMEMPRDIRDKEEVQ